MPARSSSTRNDTPRPGIRTVAVLESLKGVLVLLAGFGIFALIHRDVQVAAERIVRHFHLNPASRTPRIFLDLAGHMSDRRLWVLAFFACSYAAVRLTEAYGLWRGRRWAEWLAAVSSGIYIPIELYELANGITVIKTATLAVNTVILIVMLSALRGVRAGFARRG